MEATDKFHGVWVRLFVYSSLQRGPGGKPELMEVADGCRMVLAHVVPQRKEQRRQVERRYPRGLHLVSDQF